MKKLLALVLSIFVLLAFAACTSPGNNSGPFEPSGEHSSGQEPQESQNGSDAPNPATEGSTEDETSSTSVSSKGIATIYFGNSKGDKLNPEKRQVTEVTPEVLIQELIKGPEDPDSVKSIPDGTKLLDVRVENKIAFVNFSKEFKENHWGGTSGESMTIYSVVNTLAFDPQLDIEKVQILIEGQKVDTLAGHMEIIEPLEPNLEMSSLK